MDTTIPARSNGRTIDETWFNLIREVLSADLIPRNSSGVAQHEAGSIGDATRAWLRAYIQSGYFNVGDVKIHHSFNGTIGPGDGWMKCDGRQITQANYDAEHGAGSWVKYVGSSPLLNKYLPNMTGRYPVGASTTTQAGTSTVASVGNANNQINVSGIVASHVHQIIQDGGAGASDRGYNSSGTSIPLPTSGNSSGEISFGVVSGAGSNGVTGPLYSSTPQNVGGGGSTTQSIQPDSIEFEFYMRII